MHLSSLQLSCDYMLDAPLRHGDVAPPCDVAALLQALSNQNGALRFKVATFLRSSKSSEYCRVT